LLLGVWALTLCKEVDVRKGALALDALEMVLVEAKPEGLHHLHRKGANRRQGDVHVALEGH
jgi:hypothetical protein